MHFNNVEYFLLNKNTSIFNFIKRVCLHALGLTALLIPSPLLGSFFGQDSDPFYDPSSITQQAPVLALLGDIEERPKKAILKKLVEEPITNDFHLTSLSLERLKHTHKITQWFGEHFGGEQAEAASHGNNVCEVYISAASFSAYASGSTPSPTTIYDYYDIALDFRPTIANKMLDNGFAPYAYSIKAFPNDYNYTDGKYLGAMPSSKCLVMCENWCPKNRTGETTYSESLSLTVSGNIGGGFPPSGNVGLSVGYNITNQYSRTIKDVEIIPSVPSNKTEWTIKYHNLKLPGEAGFSPAGTLDQQLRWIWKVNHNKANTVNTQLYVPINSDNTQRYFPWQLQVNASFAYLDDKGVKNVTGYYKLIDKAVTIKIPFLPKTPDEIMTEENSKNHHISQEQAIGLAKKSKVEIEHYLS